MAAERDREKLVVREPDPQQLVARVEREAARLARQRDPVGFAAGLDDVDVGAELVEHVRGVVAADRDADRLAPGSELRPRYRRRRRRRRGDLARRRARRRDDDHDRDDRAHGEHRASECEHAPPAPGKPPRATRAPRRRRRSMFSSRRPRSRARERSGRTIDRAGRRAPRGNERVRERLEQPFAARVPLVGILGQPSRQHRIDGPRQRRPALARRRHRIAVVRPHRRPRGVAVKRRRTGQRLEQHAGQAVAIRARVGRRAPDHLRSDVVDGAEPIPGRGRLEAAPGPEVAQERPVAPGAPKLDQHVGRLQIAMDQPVSVDRVEPAPDLRQQ